LKLYFLLFPLIEAKKKHMENMEDTGSQKLNDQVGFELLTIENRIYQILKEKEEPMHVSEIISVLNLQLSDSNSTEIYQGFDFDLSGDDRFKCNNSTGYYELAEWNTNQERIEEAAENELYMRDRSGVYKEMVNKIKKEHPKLEGNTINGLINIKCLGFKYR